jgi:hypothetical protein
VQLAGQLTQIIIFRFLLYFEFELNQASRMPLEQTITIVNSSGKIISNVRAASRLPLPPHAARPPPPSLG